MNTRLTNSEQIISAGMLEKLPEPVQRYMIFSGVVGRAWIETVRVKYTGKFRTAPGRSWMPVSATQVYTTASPGFFWKAQFKMAGLPLMIGQDVYKNGHSHMHGKLAGLFTVVDGQGAEADQGTMVRYLQEMMWFPAAYLGDNITWEAVDAHAADVTFTDSGKSVSARMFFDDEGRLLNFVAQRYGDMNGKFEMHPWSTPMTEYAVFDGMKVPVHGAGVWRLPSGDFSYIEVDVTDIAYNCPIEPF